MNFKVAICSHHRPEILKNKTIKILQKHNINKELIFVFVAPDEIKTYQDSLPDYQIVPGALGLCANRNSVINYFEEDENILFLDDDIRDFYEYSPDGRIKYVENLASFVNTGFCEARKHNVSLWGFYPTPNAKWLKKTISVGLVFCYGCAFGLRIHKDTLNQISFKEDYARSLDFYLRDQRVIRLNWVAPCQSYCKGKGGLNEERTLEKEKEGCEWLKQKYGDLVLYDGKVKNNKVNVKFSRTLQTSFQFTG